MAAIAYALAAYRDPVKVASNYWPWDEDWWKPSHDPIRNLTKAGALIAAEIDRLLRVRAEKDRQQANIRKVQ